jgi:glycosyltransferase involved in cell wall biosynthesis
MRVTHVITRLIVGGAQENTIASVLGLAAKPDLELNLISGPTSGPEGSLEKVLAPQPGLLTILPELVRPIHPWKDWLAYRRLLRLFEQRHPQVVHTHSGKAGILGRLAAAQAGVPLILHTIHGPSFGSFQNAWANGIFRYAERKAAEVTNHFVVVADAMKQQYLAAGIGRADQYARIFSGFNLAQFLNSTNDPQIRRRFGITAEDIVIGKIARLFKLKGHETLFEIAPALVQSCPKIKFLLVGDGAWRERFESRAHILGLQKNFVFTGLIQPEEVPALVGIMDILVHLSVREGLPRALPQAMAAGRPIVAIDCDGAREVCLDGQTGFLLKPGDSAALTERLQHLAGNADLRARLGRNGQQFVMERFSVDQMVEDLYRLYLRLAKDKMQPRPS